ncbi:hypothetical protein PF010_g4089 [Phytophthora fragariae]|uniref:Uncharacterized protein n=1 Tax=Phytophthora fragariae TaxID=53985 RepID=A0A6G0LSL7_9STRA|nr:hypothetical protein PF010_g4089 [Phytophthora fragariae]
MKVLLRIPDLRAKLVDVRKKKPVYIPSSQHDPNDAETDVMVSIPFLDYVSEISENIVPEGLKFVDAGDVDPRGRLLRALVPERGRRVLLHARHLPARRAVQQRSTYSLRSTDLRFSTPGPGCVQDAEVLGWRDRSEYCGNLQEYEAMGPRR